jgi:uncharacterized membrane protein YeaQ/YmgE (transglycosylase-associated protein family)
MDGTLGLIIGTLLVGLIAGLLARAIVPGKDAMGILATILLGIVGSFIGTGVAYLLKLDTGAIMAWVLAIGGAVVALLVYNRIVASRAN